MLSAVKGHVFQKMGKPVLIIIFEQGPYVLNNVKTGTVLWFLVMTDVVGHPVGQFTDFYFRINRSQLIQIDLGK